MTPLPHTYEAVLTGGPTGYGVLSIAGAPPVTTSPPPQFDGPGDAWSPEHLLLASVQACFLFTLRAVAKHANVTFESLELDATGTVDRADGVTRFTGIVLRPRIRVTGHTGRDTWLRVLAKTERACLVSSSLVTPIRVEPVIVEDDQSSRGSSHAA